MKRYAFDKDILDASIRIVPSSSNEPITLEFLPTSTANYSTTLPVLRSYVTTSLQNTAVFAVNVGVTNTIPTGITTKAAFDAALSTVTNIVINKQGEFFLGVTVSSDASPTNEYFTNTWQFGVTDSSTSYITGTCISGSNPVRCTKGLLVFFKFTIPFSYLKRIVDGASAFIKTSDSEWHNTALISKETTLHNGLLKGSPKFGVTLDISSIPNNLVLSVLYSDMSRGSELATYTFNKTAINDTATVSFALHNSVITDDFTFTEIRVKCLTAATAPFNNIVSTSCLSDFIASISVNGVSVNLALPTAIGVEISTPFTEFLAVGDMAILNTAFSPKLKVTATALHITPFNIANVATIYNPRVTGINNQRRFVVSFYGKATSGSTVVLLKTLTLNGSV